MKKIFRRSIMEMAPATRNNMSLSASGLVSVASLYAARIFAGFYYYAYFYFFAGLSRG